MIKKIILTILAACDKVMTMFIPTAIVLLIFAASNTIISGWNAIIMLSVGIASTLFRGIKEVLKAYE